MPLQIALAPQEHRQPQQHADARSTEAVSPAQRFAQVAAHQRRQQRAEVDAGVEQAEAPIATRIAKRIQRPTMPVMFGFRKPTPMTISASDRYIVRSAPSSRVTTPPSDTAATPSSAMPACPRPATGRRTPRPCACPASGPPAGRRSRECSRPGHRRHRSGRNRRRRRTGGTWSGRAAAAPSSRRRRSAPTSR